MATTKTLNPTNQTITLAEFTEKPDNRVNVNNDSKLADAVNALNSKITNSPRIHAFSVPANGSVTLTPSEGLGGAYIVFIIGDSGTTALAIGVGYGQQSNRHKISYLLEGAKLSFSPSETNYGLVVTSTDTSKRYGYIVNLQGQ